MKSEITLMILCLIIVSPANATDLGISFVTGSSISAFEDQNCASGAIPLGITLSGTRNKFGFGLDAKYTLGGLGWRTIEGCYGSTTEYIGNIIVDFYGKYIFNHVGNNPYVKAALGYFPGEGKCKDNYGHESSFEIEDGIGLILGAGCSISSRFYMELNYNIVYRKMVGYGLLAYSESDEYIRLNSWSILIGYRLIPLF